MVVVVEGTLVRDDSLAGAMAVADGKRYLLRSTTVEGAIDRLVAGAVTILAPFPAAVRLLGASAFWIFLQLGCDRRINVVDVPVIDAPRAAGGDAADFVQATPLSGDCAWPQNSVSVACVELAELIAEPERYYGRRVRLRGYLSFVESSQVGMLRGRETLAVLVTSWKAPSCTRADFVLLDATVSPITPFLHTKFIHVAAIESRDALAIAKADEHDESSAVTNTQAGGIGP